MLISAVDIVVVVVDTTVGYFAFARAVAVCSSSNVSGGAASWQEHNPSFLAL
jgi:hypothetical protein